ncbi:MAG: NAD(P)H-hydrate dehydratase [Opitutae bacterium]|nr:NAD(P)H-hydrate dehydratase [Opitutae bacterium]
MPPLASHPVLTCVEAKAWEAALLQDEAAEWTAMQRAGGAIACAVLSDSREIGGLPDNARLLVLAGKGHNGGDALLAAKTLLETRPLVRADVLLCFGELALRPLARRALDELLKLGGTRVREVTFPGLKSELAGYDVCLDGVFGFQFRPPLDDATAEILAWVNTHPRLRLRTAVDLPSGLGETNAATVFRADFTYATGIVKVPVLAPANAAFVGRIRYLDLGFFQVGRVVPDEPPALQHVLLPSLLAPLAALRPAQSDKRAFGHLFVVGGSRSYPGAVLLTVQAALRSGVGLLTAFVPASLVPEYAARFPEAMWVAWPETPNGGLAASGLKLLLEKLPRASALAIGPGLGTESETLATVQEIVRAAAVPLLLDADALRPEILAAAAGKRLIATPHAGELARIAAETGWRKDGVLVAKGYPTRISAGGQTYFSLFGGPVLARGGSGDVLAGLIGGLLAQAPGDLLLAAGRGVVWHGLAADLLARDKGQVAVQTTQLFDTLQPALHSE